MRLRVHKGSIVIPLSSAKGASLPCGRYLLVPFIRNEGGYWLLFKHNYSRTAPDYFILIGGKAPPAARDGSEVARALNRRCFPHTGNVWHS